MHWILLVAALIALVLGPLFYTALVRRRLDRAVDALIKVSIAAIVVLEIVPRVLDDGGAWIIAFLLVGLFGPDLVERLIRRAARQTHLVTLLIGALGLAVHAAADGAALRSPASAHDHGAILLPLGVVLHRLPVGMAVWWLLRPALGVGVATAMMGLLVAGTVLGFMAGAPLLSAANADYVGWFQAFVAGSILHVVFNRPHLH